MPTVVIPAAGKGTRFAPATASISKEMLVLWDRPLFSYLIAEAVAAGFDRILIVTHKNKLDIVQHFTEIAKLSQTEREKFDPQHWLRSNEMTWPAVRIELVFQDEALGLGHAIACCQQKLQQDEEDYFAIALPDVLLLPVAAMANCLKQLWREAVQKKRQTIALMQVEPDEVEKYGIAQFNKSQAAPLNRHGSEVTGFVEKPKVGTAPSDYAALGRYVLHKKSLQALVVANPDSNADSNQMGKPEIALTAGLMASQVGGLWGYDPSQAIKVYDCGHPEGLFRAQAEIAFSKNPALQQQISASFS